MQPLPKAHNVVYNKSYAGFLPFPRRGAGPPGRRAADLETGAAGGSGAGAAGT